jgi:tRNA (guanine9-N1)-methyltransferase
MEGACAEPYDARAAEKERAGRAAAAALKAAQDADPVYAGLSKNARKKLARKQASAETDWKARKRQKKEQKRLRSAEQGESARAALAVLSEEEREQQRLKAWERRKAEDAKAAEWRENIRTTPFRCVIDLGFEAQMLEREVKSLVQQVLYSYGANRKAAMPWQIHLTSLQPESVQAAQLNKLSGFRSWVGVTAHGEDYLTLASPPASAAAGTAGDEGGAAASCLFAKERLVYLTADSPNEIDRIVPGDVYILGGIVDRNRYPNITYEKAVSQGIRTARLPLGEHVRLQHGTSVLTVNHMVDILLYATRGYTVAATKRQCDGQEEKGADTSSADAAVASTGGAVDWRAALLAALPQRKGVAVPPKAEQGDGSEVNEQG